MRRDLCALAGIGALCSAVPTTAAGSGTPQCAVMGWPGQIGQASPAPGFANSSQLLLRSLSVGNRAPSNTLIASGRIFPVGWLPALYAVKFGGPR